MDRRGLGWIGLDKAPVDLVLSPVWSGLSLSLSRVVIVVTQRQERAQARAALLKEYIQFYLLAILNSSVRRCSAVCGMQ